METCLPLHPGRDPLTLSDIGWPGCGSGPLRRFPSRGPPLSHAHSRRYKPHRAGGGGGVRSVHRDPGRPQNWGGGHVPGPWGAWHPRVWEPQRSSQLTVARSEMTVPCHGSGAAETLPSKGERQKATDLQSPVPGTLPPLSLLGLWLPELLAPCRGPEDWGPRGHHPTLTQARTKLQLTSELSAPQKVAPGDVDARGWV